MPLSFRSRAVSVAFGTASFFMVDENRTIRVDVARDVLARTEGPPLSSRWELADRLMRHRRYFARIADVKYERGESDAEVNVVVVRITERDLP